jgi:tetratricopeptide (TPR) repeat protein
MAIKRRMSKKNEETLLDLTQARSKMTIFLDKNQKLVYGIAAGLVLIVGGWFVYYNLIKLPQEEKATAQMWMAQAKFEQDSFVVALENPGGGYSGFLDIIKEYGGTKAGNMANYYAGISYLNVGNYDAALSFLNDFSPAGVITPTLKHGALGDAYSELNQMDKDIAQYKKASEASNNDLLTPNYMKKLGLLNETQSQVDKALVVFKKIKSKYPNSNEALSIDKYIARAEGN